MLYFRDDFGNFDLQFLWKGVNDFQVILVALGIGNYVLLLDLDLDVEGVDLFLVDFEGLAVFIADFVDFYDLVI